MRPDVIVVGGGISGLAAAYELARRGARPLVLERGEVGGEQSFGLGRIFRIAHRDPGLCALALEAADGWRRWEAELGAGQLKGSEGFVVAGRGVDVSHGAAMTAAGAEWSPLDAAEIARRVPVLGSGAPWREGLFDPLGGSLRIRRTLQALAARVEVRRAEVTRVEGADDDARVVLAHGSALSADAVVIAAGLATPRLAGTAGIEIEMGPVHHHVRLSYAMRPAATAGGPPACLVAPDGYGLPLGSTGRWAFGMEDGDAPIDAVDVEDAARDARRRQAAYVPAHFPNLDPEPIDEVRCVSIHAPWLPDDGDGHIARRSGAVVAFTGSNLMKFGPVIGERLARMALDGFDAPWASACAPSARV